MKIKNTWSVQNAPLIIMISLYVAVFFTLNPIEFPVSEANYEAPKEAQTVDISALVEKYEQEETLKARKEIKFRAVKRIYDELGIIVDYEQKN